MSWASTVSRRIARLIVASILYGPAVYALVMEVTIRSIDGIREPKSEYLLRIMQSGSPRARVLKLADRILG